jgi:heat shock protein HtpX
VPEGRRDFYTEQAVNRRRSWLLLAALVLVLGALGSAIGGAYGSARIGLLVCAGIGFLGGAAAWLGGDRMLLAASRARPAAPSAQPLLHNLVEELCLASGLPKPRLYVIESEAPNAFATGRSPGDASIAVTSGLLRKLTRDEMQGVLAHEMSHIRNLDVRFAMLVGVLVGTVALVCDANLRSGRLASGRRRRGGGALLLLALLLSLAAPIASRLIQMAVSRRRELLADASAVEMTRNPLALASALRRIGTDPAPLEAASRATQHLYIVNPVRSSGMGSTALFSTHPPIESRIRILEAMT